MSSSRTRRLATPGPVVASTDRHDAPVAIAGVVVERIQEEWVVEDRWWDECPLRRRYFELVLADGSNWVMFRDLVDGRWFSQRC